jgi:hypothetical protein
VPEARSTWCEANGKLFMTDDRILATSDEHTSNERVDVGKAVASRPQADAAHGAHRVLTCCLPNASLPTDLSKLRAMLDAHMFGRDRRALRDDAVRVARQIDSLRSERGR